MIHSARTKSKIIQKQKIIHLMPQIECKFQVPTANSSQQIQSFEQKYYEINNLRKISKQQSIQQANKEISKNCDQNATLGLQMWKLNNNLKLFNQTRKNKFAQNKKEQLPVNIKRQGQSNTLKQSKTQDIHNLNKIHLTLEAKTATNQIKYLKSYQTIYDKNKSKEANKIHDSPIKQRKDFKQIKQSYLPAVSQKKQYQTVKNFNSNCFNQNAQLSLNNKNVDKKERVQTFYGKITKNKYTYNSPYAQLSKTESPNNTVQGIQLNKSKLYHHINRSGLSNYKRQIKETKNGECPRSFSKTNKTVKNQKKFIQKDNQQSYQNSSQENIFENHDLQQFQDNQFMRTLLIKKSLKQEIKDNWMSQTNKNIGISVSINKINKKFLSQDEDYLEQKFYIPFGSYTKNQLALNSLNPPGLNNQIPQYKSHFSEQLYRKQCFSFEQKKKKERNTTSMQFKYNRSKLIVRQILIQK